MPRMDQLCAGTRTGSSGRGRSGSGHNSGMATHVALLRGINVGGRNKVPMAELRQVVTALGHTGVTTYIQTGNVLFSAAGSSTAELAAAVESAIADAFGIALLYAPLLLPHEGPDFIHLDDGAGEIAHERVVDPLCTRPECEAEPGDGEPVHPRHSLGGALAAPIHESGEHGELVVAG